jgi:amino acid transporter
MDQPPTSHSLRRHLGLGDLILTQILCVVGNTWVAVAAALGTGQSLTWVVAMLIFYIPMGAVVIYLSRQMPLEGGLYKWAKQAFGDLAGFMVAWNLWVYAMTIVAGILFEIPTELAFMLGPPAAWLPGSRWASLALIFLVLGAVTVFTIRGLTIGKWVHNIGSISILSVYIVLMCLPVFAKLSGANISWNPLSAHLPPLTLFSFAIFGQMIFGALCGLEYVALLAEESKSPARAIGLSVVFASPIICAMFILGTAAVVSFQGGDKINFIAPIPQTLRWALGNHGAGSLFASLAILLLQVRILGVVSLLFTGATRLPLAAGWDHLVPAWFARQHARWLTPVNAISFSALLIFVLLVLGSAGVGIQEGFQVLANASTSHYALTYMAMFAIPMMGNKTLRSVLPPWLKWISAVGFCATLFSLLISAFPFVDVVNPQIYAIKVLGTTLLSNILGFAFYRMRQGRAASGDAGLNGL